VCGGKNIFTGLARENKSFLPAWRAQRTNQGRNSFICTQFQFISVSTVSTGHPFSGLYSYEGGTSSPLLVLVESQKEVYMNVIGKFFLLI
jgi:hypothetical protein